MICRKFFLLYLWNICLLGFWQCVLFPWFPNFNDLLPWIINWSCHELSFLLWSKIKVFIPDKMCSRYLGFVLLAWLSGLSRGKNTEFCHQTVIFVPFFFFSMNFTSRLFSTKSGADLSTSGPQWGLFCAWTTRVYWWNICDLFLRCRTQTCGGGLVGNKQMSEWKMVTHTWVYR